MDREKAKEALQEGKLLYGRAWHFWKSGWACNGGCCNSDDANIEEILDTIEMLCEWGDIIVTGD
jgi:hypothetical protein